MVVMSPQTHRHVAESAGGEDSEILQQNPQCRRDGGISRQVSSPQSRPWVPPSSRLGGPVFLLVSKHRERIISSISKLPAPLSGERGFWMQHAPHSEIWVPKAV